MRMEAMVAAGKTKEGRNLVVVFLASGFAFVTWTLTNANPQPFCIRYSPRYIPLFPTFYVLFKHDTLVWSSFLLGPTCRCDRLHSCGENDPTPGWFQSSNIPSAKVLLALMIHMRVPTSRTRDLNRLHAKAEKH